MALLTVTAGVVEATSSWPWAVLLGVAGVVALRLGIGSTNSGPSNPAVIALVALAMGLRSTAALRSAIPGTLAADMPSPSYGSISTNRQMMPGAAASSSVIDAVNFFLRGRAAKLDFERDGKFRRRPTAPAAASSWLRP
jgi:hypothetical protein